MELEKLLEAINDLEANQEVEQFEGLYCESSCSSGNCKCSCSCSGSCGVRG